jgi:23S rRNA (adenine2503-C2)-methyltransferase
MNPRTFAPRLFCCTAEEFQSSMIKELGRGKDQALALYSEWHREGSLSGSDPCFTNCPALCAEMIRWASPSLPTIKEVLHDGGCSKLVLRLHDDLEVETVVIPMRAGETVCVSSQVGCAMGCAFCETGRMGLMRSLSAAEIVVQVWLVKHHLGRTPRNIVFMGMGEPFDNFDAVHQAVRILMDPQGLAIGPRHITISTVGRVDGIQRMITEMDPRIHLALSLNASSDASRSRLMPINKKWDLSCLRLELERLTALGRSVLVEYILIAGVTDRMEDADRVASFLNGLNVRVNCIPYNPQSRARFQAPEDEQVRAFLQRLREHGLPALLRQHKGRSAMAACGQLGNVELRKKLLTKSQEPTGELLNSGITS